MYVDAGEYGGRKGKRRMLHITTKGTAYIRSFRYSLEVEMGMLEIQKTTKNHLLLVIQKKQLWDNRHI